MSQSPDEDPIKRVLAAPDDDPASALPTVVAVEKDLRRLRSFAALVVGNRSVADELVEDALILYLSTDPGPAEAGAAFAFLVKTVRRMVRAEPERPRRSFDLDPSLEPLMSLPLDSREVAGLHLGAGVPHDAVSILIDRPAGHVLTALTGIRAAIGTEVYDRIAPDA